MMTIGRKWLLASAALALGNAGAAYAQYGMPTPAPPQSMPDHGQPAAAPAASTAAAAPATAPQLIAAAVCVIGRNAAAGDALFATPPFSAAERQQAMRLLPDLRRCLRRVPISSPASMIRGAFAEAAVEALFPTPPARRDPPLGAAPLIRPTEGDPTFLAQIAPMYQLVDCATPGQPDLARAVLATDPGTPAEGTALTALYPAFRACVPAGTQLSVDPRLMRFMFAEALYRWSVVQRDGPASPLAAAPAASAATASSQ